MRIILVGYGQMGQMIADACAEAGDIEIMGVVHPGLFESPLDVPGEVDAIVDFSYPGNLDAVLEYAGKTRCALVIGTTGYSDEQLSSIRAAAERTPVMHSSNYSLGIAVMKKVLREVSPALLDTFDVEIVETHHKKKVDAPSGTAKMLLEAIDPDAQFERRMGREGITGPRGREIGISAIRGGTVAGEHSVHFFGTDEVLTFTHSAASRRIFVNGAIRALRYIVEQPAGLYTLDDAINTRED